MLSAESIVELHDRCTRIWHEPVAGEPELHGATDLAAESKEQQAWLGRVAEQHRANFDLWHIEDEARKPEATDAEIAAVKRRIDSTNQLRNDLAEQLDTALMGWLGKRNLPNTAAALHSESPGLMIDRLSILALKIYHTREEAERQSAPEGHAARNRERLAILDEQRADLAGCLDEFWKETLEGRLQFKIYRQLKMYNDPALNPAIYRKAAG